MTLLTLLIVLLVLSFVFGGYGHTRWGYAGWSPAAVILVVFVVLYLTGKLHF